MYAAFGCSLACISIACYIIGQVASFICMHIFRIFVPIRRVGGNIMHILTLPMVERQGLALDESEAETRCDNMLSDKLDIDVS